MFSVHLISRIGALTSVGVLAIVASVPAGASASPIGAAQGQPARGKNGTYTDKSSGMSLKLTRMAVDRKGSGFIHPSRGKEFVIFYMVFHNGGRSNYDYNPLDVELVDQSGQTFMGDAFIPDKYSPKPTIECSGDSR